MVASSLAWGLRSFILLGLALLGCDKKENQPDNLVGSGGLMGSAWTGFYTPQGDALGTSLTTQEIRMNFSSDKKFDLYLVSQVSSAANGNFRDMPRHQSVILEIKESTHEAFGKKGEILDLEYDLADSELLLKGKKGIYKLFKEDRSQQQPNQSGETLPILGNWRCLDEQKNQWQIDIQHAEFWGGVNSEAAASLIYKGKVQFLSADNSAVLLAIMESNNKQVIGAFLKVQLTGAKTAEVVNADKDGKPLEGKKPFPCSK